MLWCFELLMLWCFELFLFMLWCLRQTLPLRSTRTGRARWGTRVFTSSRGTRSVIFVIFVSLCKKGRGCLYFQLTISDVIFIIIIIIIIIFVIMNQEPIPHLDEGLNNKEMNEELLNYLTCGDVHPNVLGSHCLCCCYPTGKLYSTEPSSC